MILRRITKHVKEQNWLAVGLDFFIVVFGVFMGLQVQQWNEARVARAEEHSYLARLRVDIASSISQNEWQVGFMQRQLDYSVVVLKNLSACNVAPDERTAFASGVFLIGKALPAAQVSGVIDELNATGKFQYIRNDDIRKKITLTMILVKRSKDVYSTKLITGVQPLSYVRSQIGFQLSEPLSEARDIRWEEIDIDLPTLCADQQFRNSILSLRVIVGDAILISKPVLNEQRSLLALLDIELGRPAVSTAAKSELAP